MKKQKTHKEVKKFKFKFFALIFLADLIAVVISYFVMPLVQNFPPYTEDFAFQDAVQVLTHVQQYTVALVFGVILHTLSFKFLMKNIYKFLNKFYRKESISYEEILKFIKDCINIKYKFY